MSIPDYQSIMLPLLRFFGDGKEYSLREAIDSLSQYYHLTEEEQKQLLPSGQQGVFNNRVGWARTYMKKAGLLDSTRRGYCKITERGISVLKKNPAKIDVEILEQFEEFREFRSLRHKKQVNVQKQESDAPEDTSEEALENAYQSIRENLAVELLQQIKASSPRFFEKLVVELLVKMGYGGNLKDAGQAIGKTNDEGIDGIIKEDRLGLDIIYVQAKRWENTISRPEIQKFAGALQGQRARKGIMITTSTFSKEAYNYTSKIDTKIVLINGIQLAQLMIDFNLGVSSIASYEIKRIDIDYFTEE